METGRTLNKPSNIRTLDELARAVENSKSRLGEVLEVVEKPMATGSRGMGALKGLVKRGFTILSWLPVLTASDEGSALTGVVMVKGCEMHPTACVALSIPAAFIVGTEIRREIDNYYDYRASEREWSWCTGTRVSDADTGRPLACIEYD